MPTFSEQFALTQDADFRLKCQMAAVKVAAAVLDDGARTAEHPYCRLILREPTNPYWINQVVFSTLTNTVMDANSTDADFEFTVTTQFPTLATEINNL
jgi:hypothetical protein